ncbi:MAG: ATP-binding cassette domain-containing protein [Alphaproteobacteria bacterium]
MVASSRFGPNALAFAFFAVVVILFPLIFTGRYEIGTGITVGAMAIATVGFVLLIGYAHQLALGQAAFCMIGGYGNSILVTKYGVDPMVAMVASMVVAMLLAYVIGKPILKLRGFILAMASLALQLVMIFIALEWESQTGGALGITNVPTMSVFGLKLTNDLHFYYLVWALVALAIFIGLNIDRSRIGRALRSIGSSETAALSVGVDITRYKLEMFVVSAAMASVSGSVMVHYLRLMEPHLFGFQYSLNIITAVIAGGLMSIWGGAVGAFLIVFVREGLREMGGVLEALGFGKLNTQLWEVVTMGALTVLVLIFFPRGLVGFIQDAFTRKKRRAAEATYSGLSSAADIASAPPPFQAASPSDGSALLVARKVEKSFGSLRAVADVGFEVKAGSITALIGPNGAGKTTMFNLVSGYLPLDSGTIEFAGKRIEKLLPDQIAKLGIGRTFQNLQLFDNMTVLENVMTGRHRLTKSGLVAVSARVPSVGREEAEIRAKSMAALAFVGLADVADKQPSALPFGHQRLLEIARALALEPRLLLMDEPASGLNDTETEQVAELILRIRELGTTILLVEHDIRLVMGLAEQIVVMNYGEKIAEGDAEIVRNDKNVIAAYLGDAAT